MKQLKLLTILIIVALVFAFTLTHVQTAQAQPPNDDFDSATVITSLPFTDSINTTDATVSSDDPPLCVYEVGNTVWYRYTPSTTKIYLIDTIGSSYGTVVGVFTGTPGSFNHIICGNNTSIDRLSVTLYAGETYSIIVGNSSGSYPYPGSEPGGDLIFNMEETSSPSNDDFDNAQVITSLPYNDLMDTTYATSAIDDPDQCFRNASVWYSYTAPYDINLEVNTAGSNYDTTLAVYTGTRGNLSIVDGACNDDSVYGLQSRIIFQATAGVTYYFLAGAYWGDMGGSLVFNLIEMQPPSNDSFTNALEITELPFYYEGELLNATLESGEPLPSCVSGYTPTKSVWFKYQASQDQYLTLSGWTYGYIASAVYTGSSLTSLNELGCRNLYAPLSFSAAAGTTYYIQLINLFDPDSTYFHITLDVTPPPIAVADCYPALSNIYDEVSCYSDSYDPAGVGIKDYYWDFGDGTTGAGYSVYHQYRLDGDYTISLTIETWDGRTNTSTCFVGVRTHDIAITKFLTPSSASPGQTRTIKVGIRNNRYPEKVEVVLWKGEPNKMIYLGSVIMDVPVSKRNKTTEFAFNYTFTEQDGVVGKVNFWVSAYLIPPNGLT